MKILHVADTSIYNYDGIASYINELMKLPAASSGVS